MAEVLKLAVVGGGWAGLAAAVQAIRDGHQVSLFEMAAQLGGRARSVDCKGVDAQDLTLDNGQHILIGAYRQSLALMRQVGAEPEELLQRLPLRLCYPDLDGLSLMPGHPVPAFARAVLACADWTWPERLSLLRHCTVWALKGFRCDPKATVAQLCATLPRPVREQLIAPLCVASLNTPADQASAAVFLRVLKDALFSGPGSSDLLLPRWPLSDLLAGPAADWLRTQGARLHLGQRVSSLVSDDGRWLVDDERFDAVVLACTASEAARLVEPIAAGWAQTARDLRYEPIVTVYLQSPGSHLPVPMMALHEGPQAPAQFVFDLGQIHQSEDAAGRFAFVISGARGWLDQGLDATAEATLQQAQQALPAHWARPPQLLRALTEKRATFACTPGLQRPEARIAPGLMAAGDYVQGPYPATLEGAVMSGNTAARGLTSERRG
ncbi:hydroxysqualene dehydroxylase HpnE [Roseateles toxinivorans]|uniref:Squalene-associated FAD-dependent desaturase n=1 Tax=Roseateles toxinivorans TaxID=270368 RepID=A0A4R6QL23_9BURK|nr:hydroxysqualene dehydroxylase HpnE [Roseateles toxinivorans]TDP64047.1 squalene-associated FAD-dependent desaturase [Roseateles toxinivorans]